MKVKSDILYRAIQHLLEQCPNARFPVPQYPEAYEVRQAVKLLEACNLLMVYGKKERI